MTIPNGRYTTTASTVIYDPTAPATSGGTTPNQLVFLQPTTPGTGTINAAISPQPIVAIEDHGNIVYSDASSLTLSIVPGKGPAGGALSNNCSSVENEGVFVFGGCSLSAVGSYTLQATDSDGLTTLIANDPTYSIATALLLSWRLPLPHSPTPPPTRVQRQSHCASERRLRQP